MGGREEREDKMNAEIYKKRRKREYSEEDGR